MKKGSGNCGKKLFILVISFIILLILVVTIRSSIKSVTKTTKHNTTKNQTEIKTNNTYSIIETKIKVAAQRYQNDNYQATLESNETIVLKYKMLRESGYLSHKLVDINDKECDGYVIFNKVGARISYAPYIKCGNNYQTENFDRNLIK